MNERNTTTDDRLVDTLVAMHDSLKVLMRQGEQDRARAAAPQAQLRMGPVPNEPAPVTFTPPVPPVATPATETAPSFGTVKRASSSEDASGERSRRGTAFIRDIPFDSTEDLVAAARRAAQAAAARAEERDALRLRRALADEPKRAPDEPGRHKFSLLVVAAA